MKRIVVLAAAALMGCGPSASSLVGQKHYREALCSESDESLVAKSLWQAVVDQGNAGEGSGQREVRRQIEPTQRRCQFGPAHHGLRELA